MNIYSQVIGQVIRFGLTFLAAYLAVVGVTENMQHELVETTVNILVPVALGLGAQVWSIINKRYLYGLDPNAPTDNQPPSISVIIAVFALAAVLITSTGCPWSGNTTVQKARAASAKLSVLGEKVIQANIDAYKAGEISVDQFRSLNKVTRKYVDGVRAYRAAVEIAENAIKAGADARTELGKIQAIFLTASNAAVDLAQELKLITGSQAETVRNIIVGIELALSTVATFFAEAGMPVVRKEVLV